MALKDDYAARRAAVLTPLAEAIEEQIRDYLSEEPRVDRVQARAKSTDRFIRKAEKLKGDGELKYADPLHEIQDQVGVRIVTFYLSDVERLSPIVHRYFRPVEERQVVPEKEWEFGYFGKHFILLVPPELIDPAWDAAMVPEFFELQIKTLFQHAWSEAEHDIAYKEELGPLPEGANRLLAFTSAQAWGADRAFDDLVKEITQTAR